LNVTIYNQDRALVKDERQVKLNQGINNLSFAGVSANMMPQSALLKGFGISTREQNFNFDLLTHNAMMTKSVGSMVTVEYIDPATGKKSTEKAKLLAYNDGRPVLLIDDKIETNYPGRVIFNSVPTELRADPTLTMSVFSESKGTENLQLDYLTTGLSWQADYVGRLNTDETKMDLNGFVTLTNRSGAVYKNAQLQLVAGAVNVVEEYRESRRHMVAAKAYVMMDAAGANLAPEALTDFYIYTVPHKTDLLSNQTKQVALLTTTDLGIQKTYELNYPFSVYAVEQKNMKPQIYVSFENTQNNKLGMPLPKGVVRLYKEDQKGLTQFVGEDRIDHVAENGTVRLHIGESFNLTADMKRTAHKKLSDKLQQGTYEVTFKNGSDVKADVRLMLDFPDDFKLMEESQKGERMNSNVMRWVVSVPAKGEAKLTFRVQF